MWFHPARRSRKERKKTREREKEQRLVTRYSEIIRAAEFQVTDPIESQMTTK